MTPVYVFVNASCAGYDVQSASTDDGELYITGAPRYNHTGRVVIYRLDADNNIVVSQILKGEQVSLNRPPGMSALSQFLSLLLHQTH